MLKRFLEQARADEPVMITDVRDEFLKEGTRPFHLHVELYDGSRRRFAVLLPVTETEEEAAFAASYVHALISNILSSLGAVSIEVYVDPDDAQTMALAEGLNEVFQAALPRTKRSGYGRYMNVNERVLQFLSGGQKHFAFRIMDCRREPAVEEKAAHYDSQPVFTRLPARAEGRRLLGIDIGGTDIKLVSSYNGSLALCKEFDWFPASYTRAELLTDPVLLLARLMRAGTALVSAGMEDQVDKRAFSREASSEEMEAGILAMETALGHEPENFDGIGLSFPDIVIDNRIVGGETFKTKGMRDNKELDYEAEFAKVSALNELLAVYVKPDGCVMNTNDGNMSAFTTAVELAAAGEDVSQGFFAHTLGTELGTGWVKPDGSIPGIPLEVYNYIIDLGSFGQKKYPSSDIRSINNFNTDLPGTLQKYTSQYGVFRMAAKYLPQEEPGIFREAFEKGIFIWEGEELAVPTAPKDMRKPALEFFMEKAASGSSKVCERIFREVGRCLAVTWQETEYILRPEAKERTLYGRLVKMPECFNLINEGARERVPGLVQKAADSGMANTGLMKQLAAHPVYTVAQFAQAVGGLYFGCLK